MPRIQQGIQDIKHLVLLRRALISRQSLEIYSRDPAMRLVIDEGRFHGGDCIDSVRTMIERPLPVFSWDCLETKAHFIARDSKETLARAICKMTPDRERLLVYLQAFSRLPRIRMRVSTAFRIDPAMQNEYQALYRLSLSGQGASVREYLVASAGGKQLKRRIGIVIAGYCLGDFVPAEKADRRAGNSGIVSRILARFRRKR